MCVPWGDGQNQNLEVLIYGMASEHDFGGSSTGLQSQSRAV